MVVRKPIGKVTHYYPKISVAVVALSAGLKTGEKVSIEKGEAKTEQTITSMQVEHKHIDTAKKGQEIAIKTEQEVKEGSLVYKA